MKQKHKRSKSSKAPKPQVLEKNTCLHMLGSSEIGARVAYPLDAEYCMLDNFLPLRKKKDTQEAMRPDSLSESSDITSSNDSNRMNSSCDLDFDYCNLSNCFSDVLQLQESYYASSRSSEHSKSTHASSTSLSSLSKMTDNCHTAQSEFRTSDCFSDSNIVPQITPELIPRDICLDTVVPCPSDGSDVSGDSYYEQKFEAIENTLAEEIFRNSINYNNHELNMSSVNLENNTISNVNDTNELNKSPDNLKILSLTDNASVLNRISDCDPVAECETTSSTFQHRKNNLFTRPVNRNIVDRLECLKNQNCQKNNSDSSPLKGIKSIRERWKKLEQGQNSNVGIVHSDPNNLTMMNNFFETGVNTNASTSDENNQPKGKGWVKHVVSKLQNETS